MHYTKKLQERLIESIEHSCKTIEKLPQKAQYFAPYKWVQYAANEGQHPEAIDRALKSLINLWPGINNPISYYRAVLRKETPKQHAKDADLENQGFKRLYQEIADKLGIFKEISK